MENLVSVKKGYLKLTIFAEPAISTQATMVKIVYVIGDTSETLINAKNVM